MIIMYVHDSDHVCVLICPRCVLICPRCVLICPISSCMCMIAIMYVYNNYHTRKIFFFAHQMVMTCVYHRPIACLQHVYRHTTYNVCLSHVYNTCIVILLTPCAYRMFTTRIKSYAHHVLYHSRKCFFSRRTHSTMFFYMKKNIM